ncbi:hypothetical protein DPEC_G00344680 [Dallia pectoralis]|uniref:Uncharacterized protein n=1 Tax=Dallia pectoralis TaxID=75939 RepID=A0ACC2F3A7_DALPE|nr:hypothetical protein DPEC_G00344680 [Dallia pectoralis]
MPKRPEQTYASVCLAVRVRPLMRSSLDAYSIYSHDNTGRTMASANFPSVGAFRKCLRLDNGELPRIASSSSFGDCPVDRLKGGFLHFSTGRAAQSNLSGSINNTGPISRCNVYLITLYAELNDLNEYLEDETNGVEQADERREARYSSVPLSLVECLAATTSALASDCRDRGFGAVQWVLFRPRR